MCQDQTKGYAPINQASIGSAGQQYQEPQLLEKLYKRRAQLQHEIASCEKAIELCRNNEAVQNVLYVVREAEKA